MFAGCRRSPILLLAACLAASACTSHDNHASNQSRLDSVAASSSSSGDTANPFRSTGHQYGPPNGKIRVANLLELHGQPSGPVDLYDVPHPDSSVTPIIANLSYGQISAYVSPRRGSTGGRSNLYLFQAHQKTGTDPFGANIDHSGFDSTDQLTIALAPTSMGSGNAGIGGVYIEEGGKRLNSMVADKETAAQAGGALLIMSAANSMIDTLPQQYLVVDGTCPSPIFAGSMQLFPVAPGSHTLGLVISPHGRTLQTCAGHSPVSTVQVNVAAGQRYVVWMYGLPTDGFKILAAPIERP